MLYLFYLERLGHGGPLTISENLPTYPIVDRIIEGCQELGINLNKSYNTGDSQGNLIHHC